MKKIAGILLILALVIVGGCSNNVRYSGSGKIVGTIENMKTELGTILPVHVFVIEENPTEKNFDPANMTIIAETTVDSDDDSYETYSYNLKNVPVGEYYVVAYKDLNGNGEIDVTEDGPIDAAGFFGMSEESDIAEKVDVNKDETVTGIDFSIENVGYTNFFEAVGTVSTINGDPIEGVEIELFGTAGIKVYESIYSNESGEFSINGGHSNNIGIVDGEYYIRASGTNYLTTVTPYFVQITTENETTPPTTSRTYWSISGEENDDVKIGAWELPPIMMITQTEAEYYGYSTGSSIIGGDIGPAGSEVIITPESGVIGYINAEEQADYNLESSQGSGYVIKEVEAGDYAITAENDISDFYDFKLTIGEDEFSPINIIEVQ